MCVSRYKHSYWYKKYKECRKIFGLTEIRSLWYIGMFLNTFWPILDGSYLSTEGSRRKAGNGRRFSLQTLLWNGQSLCWHWGPQYLKTNHFIFIFKISTYMKPKLPCYLTASANGEFSQTLFHLDTRSISLKGNNFINTWLINQFFISTCTHSKCDSRHHPPPAGRHCCNISGSDSQHTKQDKE